jgi:uncharacterized protein
MILKGRAISSGTAEGKALRINGAFSFLGGVDASTGDLKVEGGDNISGKVFVFPKGKGSTVGSFVMYDLKAHGKAPAAIINVSAETIVTTGAVISSLPMVDGIDVGLIRAGDDIMVDGTRGYVEIKGVEFIRAVSSVILSGGRVLMLHRPATARSFPDRWSLVSGKIERGETPEEAARREMMEETQISVSLPDAALPPMYVREGSIVWEIYPFLYRLDSAEPILNHENTEYSWSRPEDMSGRNVVPMASEAVARIIGI